MYTNRRHNFVSFCCNVQLCTLFMGSVTSGSYTKMVLNPQGNFGARITQSLKILSQCHPPTRCLEMSSYEKQHRIINNLNITTDSQNSAIPEGINAGKLLIKKAGTCLHLEYVCHMLCTVTRQQEYFHFIRIYFSLMLLSAYGNSLLAGWCIDRNI